jgi:hypothetical protein
MRLTILIFSAVALFLSACGGGSSSEGPKEVASKFITHINNMEFEEAKNYGTKSTQEILDMLKGFAGMAEKPESTAFEIIDVKEEGDKATVTYRNEGADADESLNLIKEDGKWLVNISKEDMDKEDGEGDDLGEMNWDDTMEELGNQLDSAMEEVEEKLEEVLD